MLKTERMKQLNELEIEFSGLKIRVGSKLRVTICEGVEVEGNVVFKDAAFCLEYHANGCNRTTPLCNYVGSCVFVDISHSCKQP